MKSNLILRSLGHNISILLLWRNLLLVILAGVNATPVCRNTHNGIIRPYYPTHQSPHGR
ncbi:MAG TPA: hypothetical protein PLD25_29280 [Chloroflexota bacterium]|nr:hypothetical protein [Chloroflexota bacterium]HUM71295.1 hypothetical protein [Chloroflexota bacterium]